MLEGKTALVTGGSGALGAAVVRVLAREHCRVAFTYNSQPDKARQIEAELAGPNATVRARSSTALERPPGSATDSRMRTKPQLRAEPAANPVRSCSA